MMTQEFNLHHAEEAQFYDYDEAIAYAKEKGKPVLVDFTGYGCVNCRKMESAVWNKPQVKELIDNEFILVSLFVDDKRSLPEPITINKPPDSNRRVSNLLSCLMGFCRLGLFVTEDKNILIVFLHKIPLTGNLLYRLYPSR